MVRILALLSLGVALTWAFTPEFYAIKNTQQKKEQFFTLLRPLVENAQTKIIHERLFVHYYFYLHTHLWSDKALERKITLLAQKYRIKEPYSLAPFLHKIDTVPMALALAQAAVESGWGESYFVKEANNLYGEWTWGKKGIVPRNRDANMTHKIRTFETLQESVDSYMLNLNRHYAYKKFREIRAIRRTQKEELLAREATKYLKNYSLLGEEYAQLLRTIIRENNLCEFRVAVP